MSINRNVEKPILVCTSEQAAIVSTMVMLKSSQWLGKNIVQNIGDSNSRKTCISKLTAGIWSEIT